MKAFKKYLKDHKAKLIGYPIAIAVIAVLVLLAVHFGKQKSSAPEEFTIYHLEAEGALPVEVIEGANGSKIEFDPNTTHFTYTDRFGHKWYSDSLAEDPTHAELSALVLITYQNNIGTRYELDSDTESVQRKNYTYEVDQAAKKVTINYTIGKISPTYYVPCAIPEARYNEIRESFHTENAASNKSDMLASYIKMTWDKVDKLDNKKYLERYPKIEEDLKAGAVIYLLRDNVPEWKKAKLQGILEDEIAYTKEDWEKDQEQYCEETSGTSQPAVNVTLEVMLEGDELVVNVPFEKIAYKSAYPLTELYVLPYMLSEPSNSDGYLFVPDGSGALINFNNQKGQQAYSAKIYGHDYAMTQDVLISDPRVNYPIYGIGVTKRTSAGQAETLDQGLLAIIESGDSYGTLKASVPGGTGANVNYVTTKFDIIHNEQVNVASRSTAAVFAYEKELARDENITIRFRPIATSSYVDMAKSYREYYIAKNPSLATKVSGTMPVAVELVGAIEKIQHILGIPKERPFAMTTYDQMVDIVKDLNNEGVTNLSVIMEGWFNDGIKHDVPDDVSLIGVLGGKKDFKNAIKKIQENNTLYLKSSFTFVYENGWFDSYSYRRDTAKYISREFVKKQKISDVWYGIDEESEYFYLANPAYIEKTVRGFYDEIKDFDIKNIAFADVGNNLAADYNRKKTVTREKAKNKQVSFLADLLNDGSKMVLYDPYAYAIPDSSLIVDMDVDSTHNCLTDTAVPFFPIVLHGYVDFTGDALNVTGDFTSNLLNCAESGSGLYFIFMNNSGMDLAESEYTYLYGANYDSWKADALKWYKRFKEDFSGIYDQTIEDHKVIAEDVKMTQYADGTRVYVNYRTAEFTTDDGITIPAQDWVVRKGGN